VSHTPDVFKGYNAKQLLDASYLPWETIEEDKTVAVRHHECLDTGAADHKERLYITNKGGTFLFHCFNCGAKGVYTPKELPYGLIHKVIDTGSEDTTAYNYGKVHKDFCNAYDNKDDDIPLWLLEHDFGKEEVRFFNIAYDKRGIYLPVFDDVISHLKGIQIRNFSGKPKYSTYMMTRDTPKGMHLRQTEMFVPQPPLFITEDILSAYKLYSAGADVFALMGTSGLPSGLPNERVVLWLDDDFAGHKGALELYKNLKVVYPSLTAVFMQEPKTMPIEELKNIVTVRGS